MPRRGKRSRYLFSDKILAPRLDVSTATLRRWRSRDQGPPYVRVGRAIRYVPEAVAQWLASRPGGGER